MQAFSLILLVACVICLTDNVNLHFPFEQPSLSIASNFLIKPPFITHEEFTAALNDRLAAENSSYAEKEIEEIRLQKQISSELETIEKEKNKIVDFIEYLSIKSKEKED